MAVPFPVSRETNCPFMTSPVTANAIVSAVGVSSVVMTVPIGWSMEEDVAVILIKRSVWRLSSYLYSDCLMFGMAAESRDGGDAADSGRSVNPFYIGLGIVVVVVGVSFLLSGQSETDPVSEEEIDEFADDYASVGEDRGRNMEGVSEVESEVAIERGGVSPARVSGDVGDTVRFNNDLPYAVRLRFDDTTEPLVVESGGSGVMQFRGIVYYDVLNEETGDGVARGSVAVQ